MTDIRADDGLPRAARQRAMATLSIAMFLAVLDAVIANIALPSIASELAVTPAQSVWVMNAYQLAMTVALLPLSSLGDIRGYRRVYLIGLGVFTVASLACGLAGSLPMLVAARAIQGLGAAGITSVNMALVRHIYPRAQLGRGMGIMGLVVATAAVTGPSIAAAILAVAPWQYLFLLNVPLGALAFGLAVRAVPATPGAGHRFDRASAALNAIGLGLMFVGTDGLVQSDGRFWSIAALAGGIAVFTGFVRRQLALEAPMLPLDLLRLPMFAMAVLTSVCAYICQTMAFLALPFYFQYAGGQSPIETGLLMTPWPVALMVVAPISGRLADRYPAGLLCGVGLAILAGGMLLLNGLAADAQLTTAILPMLICGIGFGLFQTPNNRAFMASAPPARSGACAGMMTTSRLTGQTIGGLIVAMVFALAGVGRNGTAHGTLIVLGIAVAFAAVAMAVSFGRLGRSASG